jgi:type I restriction enzyme S subunit
MSQAHQLVGLVAQFNDLVFLRLLKDYLNDDSVCLPLGDLWVSSPRSGYSATASSQDTGHYVLTLTALSRAGYQPNQVKSVERIPEILRARLRVGDFLISRSNTIELVGLVGIFDEDRDDVSFPDTMMLLEIDERKILKRFLERYLLSAFARLYIQKIAAGTSASMKKINRGNLSTLPVPVPAMEAQFRILRIANAGRTAVKVAESRLEQTRTLKTCLLRSLLPYLDGSVDV